MIEEQGEKRRAAKKKRQAEYYRKCRAAETPEERIAANKRQVERNRKHRAAMTPEKRAAWKKQVVDCHRLRRTGVTPERYDQMLREQEGLCAICTRPEWHTYKGKIKQLSADHDHKTGEARRLLCNRCNNVLGWVDDDVAVLENMVNYLKRHGL